VARKLEKITRKKPVNYSNGKCSKISQLIGGTLLGIV